MIAQYYYSEKNNTLYINTDILVPKNPNRQAFEKAFQMTIRERLEEYTPKEVKKAILEEIAEHKDCNLSEFTY